MRKIIRFQDFFLLVVAIVFITELLFKITPLYASLLEDDKTPHVEVQNPQRKDMARSLNLPGNIMANQEVTVFARVGGYLEKFNVDRGSWVKKGDVLATLSTPELEKQLELDQANLALTEPTLKKAQADLEWKETNYKRAAGLISKSPNLVSQGEVDKLKGEYEIANATVAVVKARLPIIKAKMEKSHAMVNYATLRAPFDGVITDRWVDEGDLIQPSATKMFDLLEVDPVRVRFYVSEPDAPWVKEGSKITMTIDELSGKKWEAIVSRVSWALSQNTKTMLAEADIKNDPHEIRPGMYAHLTLDLEVHPNTLTIPATALVIEGKNIFAFVVTKGIARKVPLSIGLDSGIEVEILGGISDQDEVVITGKNLISDGEPVLTSKKDNL